MIDEKKRLERRERLTFLAKLNKKKCEACPIYGSDLIEAVTILPKVSPEDCSTSDSHDLPWSAQGKSYSRCLNAVQPLVGRRSYEFLWSQTDALCSLIHTPEKYIVELKDVIERCVPSNCALLFVVPLGLFVLFVFFFSYLGLLCAELQ